MTLATVDNGGSAQNDFDKYFSNSDLFDLLSYNPKANNCETLDMLLKRDGFPYISTPTNDKHIGYLKSVKLVLGLSLNSNLYANNAEVQIPYEEPEVFKPPVRV